LRLRPFLEGTSIGELGDPSRCGHRARQVPARPRAAAGAGAVPGSTVAFDLPGGGFYVGLPLAIAAIVLGVDARRDQPGSKRALAAIVIAGICIAQMTVWTLVSDLG
jgi:hypothetical protein